MQISTTRRRIAVKKAPEEMRDTKADGAEEVTNAAPGGGPCDKDSSDFLWIERSDALYMEAVRIAPDSQCNAAYLEIDPIEDPPAMAEEFRQLLARIESTDSLIRLVTSEPKRLARYKRLRGIALMGLVGKSPDPASAAHLLTTFRGEDLTEDLKAARNDYIVANTWKMGLAGFSALALGFLAWTNAAALAAMNVPASLPEGVAAAGVVNFIAATLFGITGFAVGDIFTSLWAGQSVDPDRFRANRRYRFSGWLRLTFGATLWIAVLSLLSVDWLILGVGGVTINEATEGKPLLGFVGGLIVALAFDQAGRTVGDRARQAFQSGEAPS